MRPPKRRGMRPQIDDLYSQALAKIERGFDQDREDMREMLGRGLISAERLRDLYEEIEPELYRYPAIDHAVFRQRLEAALA